MKKKKTAKLLPGVSLFVYAQNDEADIVGCIANTSDIADEIVVIHNGECSDRTLEIAKREGAQTLVVPLSTDPESLRALAFERARFSSQFFASVKDASSSALRYYVAHAHDQFHAGGKFTAELYRPGRGTMNE